MALNNVFPVRLSTTAAAGATNQTLTYPVAFAGTVRNVHVRMFAGNQLSLQLKPQRLRREELQSLVSYAGGGKQYIDGDDETEDFSTSVDVQPGDVLQVTYTNTDATNAYDFAVDLTIIVGSGGGR